MEGAPNTEAAAESGGYDKETALDAARIELQERLLDVEVPEGTPEEFHSMAKLEAFVASLEDPQAERHLIKAANVELNELMDETPHGVVQAYERHKMQQQVFGASMQEAA